VSVGIPLSVCSWRSWLIGCEGPGVMALPVSRCCRKDAAPAAVSLCVDAAGSWLGGFSHGRSPPPSLLRLHCAPGDADGSFTLKSGLRPDAANDEVPTFLGEGDAELESEGVITVDEARELLRRSYQVDEGPTPTPLLRRLSRGGSGAADVTVEACDGASEILRGCGAADGVRGGGRHMR